jgi:cAMP-dependent protein kinase regulator
VPKVIKKSKEAKTNIRALLHKSLLFSTLSDMDINIVVDAMSIENHKKGDEVIREGDQGLTLYVVGSGEYNCSKVIHGVKTFLKTYTTGESFGELALMYTAPRAATIVCSQQGVLYGLDRQTFKSVVEEAANKRR